MANSNTDASLFDMLYPVGTIVGFDSKYCTISNRSTFANTTFGYGTWTLQVTESHYSMADGIYHTILFYKRTA